MCKCLCAIKLHVGLGFSVMSCMQGRRISVLALGIPPLIAPKILRRTATFVDLHCENTISSTGIAAVIRCFRKLRYILRACPDAGHCHYAGLLPRSPDFR